VKAGGRGGPSTRAAVAEEAEDKLIQTTACWTRLEASRAADAEEAEDKLIQTTACWTWLEASRAADAEEVAT